MQAIDLQYFCFYHVSRAAPFQLFAFWPKFEDENLMCRDQQMIRTQSPGGHRHIVLVLLNLFRTYLQLQYPRDRIKILRYFKCCFKPCHRNETSGYGRKHNGSKRKLGHISNSLDLYLMISIWDKHINGHSLAISLD